MSSYSHQTVPTQFAEAAGIRFAYRRFGKKRKRSAALLYALHGNNGSLGSRRDRGETKAQLPRRCCSF
jgi:hypothetical protein